MKRKSLAVLLVLMMIFTLAPQTVFAATPNVKVKTEVAEFETGDAINSDFIKITTAGSQITVSYQSILPAVKYRLSLRKIGKQTICPAKKDFVATNKGFTETLYVSSVPDGTYYLMLARAADSSQAVGYTYIGGSKGYVFIGIPVKVQGGKATVVTYSEVIKNNKAIREAASGPKTKKYLDTSLADIKFVFNDPATGKLSRGTTIAKMKSYFKKVSDLICKNEDNDYEKVRKIYAYVADNFYYDTIAFQQGKNQYINPYKNLYNLRNNKSSKNSVKTSGSKAKVATTCIGNASIVAGLTRSQGIPTRIVYGHALTSPWNTWDTETNVKTLDHWWAECYVDGEWIVVDPTRGTNAKWDSRNNTWDEPVKGVLSYNYFDPSDEFLANTHLYQGIK